MRVTIALYFLFTILFPFSISAQLKISPLNHYIHRYFTTEDGLPQNRCRVLLQTRDGYLWIGTRDGLARFDGTMFRVFNAENTPALKHSDISSLYETKDGSLWIGTFAGITQLRNGTFISHPVNTGPIRGIASDSSGTLWFGTSNKGIYRLKEGTFDSLATTGFPGNSLRTLTVDRRGNVWIAHLDEGCAILQRGIWKVYNKNNGLPSNAVRAFFPSPDGSMWIGTEKGLVHWTNGSLQVYTMAHGLSDNVISSLYQDRKGILWIGTEHGGIYSMENGLFASFRKSDGLTSNFVQSICEDEEGCLWVGTRNEGLNQFWKGKFVNISNKDGISKRDILCMVLSHTGLVYVGSERGGIVSIDNRHVVSRFAPVPQNELIRTMYEDSRHALWISQLVGLVRYQNGKKVFYPTKDSVQLNQIRVMAEDHDQYLWAGTYGGGISRLENNRLVSYEDKGLPMKSVRSILTDHNGTVWFGSDEGIFTWHKGSASHIPPRAGIPTEPVVDMKEDSSHTLWMGTYGGGLIRKKDSTWTQYTVENGLYNNIVMKILEDQYDNLWLSSRQGISCVSKKMLNDFAEGKIDRIYPTSYTTSDGMISHECTFPYGCRTPDGRLWFPTSKGIVIVDPKSISKNKRPPFVSIQRVVIDTVEYSPSDFARLPRGTGQVEIYYGGIAFIAPHKVHYRYILEGFEDEWRFVETRRAAFFTNLPPGKYQFRATACNSDGIWNETDAKFAFELVPRYYQTTWFYFLVAISIAVVVFGIYLARVWQLLQKEKNLEQRVRERTHQLQVMNQELETFSYSVSHDLRAPLRTINGFSGALLEDYGHTLDDQGKDFLRRVCSASKHMERLIDDILNLSRIMRTSVQRTTLDLSNIAQSIVRDLSRAQPDRKVICIIAPAMEVYADRNLMEIVLQNLLENAWKFTSKHPSANIEVGWMTREGQKIYFVRDDGDGFDMAYAGKLFKAFQRIHTPAEFEGTGIGLTTVRRIIDRHGGRVWVEAEKDKGATFYFTISEYDSVK